MSEPSVLTVEEAAAVLRIGRSAAYTAVRCGDIPSVRLGRSLRVPRHQLEAMLGMPSENDNGDPKKVAEVKEPADGPTSEP